MRTYIHDNRLEITWWPKEISRKSSGIYKITSPNGRIYIGQSKNIWLRWKEYCRIGNPSNLKQHLLHRSFQKYGVKCHKFEILCHLDFYNKVLLNDLEIHYIRLFCSFCDWQFDRIKKGLNLTQGGNIGVLSTPTKEKRAKIKMPKRPFRNLSEQHKLHIKLAQIGRKKDLSKPPYCNRISKTVYKFDFMGNLVKCAPLSIFTQDGNYERTALHSVCKRKCNFRDGFFYSYNPDFKPDYSIIGRRLNFSFKKRFGFDLLNFKPQLAVVVGQLVLDFAVVD